MSFTILDVNGKQVFSETKGRATTEYKLNLKPLPAGIYMMKIKWSGNEVLRRVIKQ